MDRLKNSCANCEHFDGDVHCAIPGEKLIQGFIVDPERVVCEKHEESEAHRKDREQLEELNAADRQTALDGAAYENALSRLGGQY